MQQLIKRAMVLHHQQHYVEAIKLYEQILRNDPASIQAWTNLGIALRKLKHYQSAFNCQLRALELQPDNSLILNNLANVCKDVNEVELSVRYARRACELEPENIGYQFNLAVNLREAKAYEEALQTLERCISLDPSEKPKYEWEMALCHLYLDNRTSGWQAYKARLHTGHLPKRNFACDAWQGEPLAGKKLWVVTEQGFGDTLFAVRYLPSLVAAGADVIVEVKSPLQRLLSSLPVQLVEPQIAETAAKGCDYYVYLMDLPGMFELLKLPVPAPVNLQVPLVAQQKFRELISSDEDHIKVGVVWSGSETFGDNARRSPGLEPFLPLAALPNVRLYSLQKGAREKDLDRYFARSFITDLSPHINDFADTAAAIMELDLVVMSDSAVAHLTASLGKPVWNLLHCTPYWMYGLQGESTHWYPSMRFIRQTSSGDWKSVFDEVEQKLKNFRIE